MANEGEVFQQVIISEIIAFVLALKELDNIFENVISVSNIVCCKCHIFSMKVTQYD